MGISFDSPAENRAFAEKNAYPFPLLCDTSREVGLAYRAIDSLEERYPKRFTYVISPEGKIEVAIDTKSPGAQAGQLLQGS